MLSVLHGPIAWCWYGYMAYASHDVPVFWPDFAFCCSRPWI